MSTEQLILTVLSTLNTLLLGVVAFFLKRSFNQLDSCASKKELDELRSEMVKKLECQQKDIVSIKTEYITKEDFYRVQGETTKKLDRIMDILLEIKGGGGNRG